MAQTLYDSKSELTRNALADSLKELMITKAIHKISIREITENCGYKRLTFYYHFDDIYDLLKWTIRRELILPLRGNSRFQTWEDVVLYILHYLQNNEMLALSVLDSVGRETLRKLLSEDAYSFCLYFLRDIGKDLSVSEEDYHALCHFYCISLAALCADWLENGMSDSPESLTQTLSTIIHGSARQALLRFSKQDD